MEYVYAALLLHKLGKPVDEDHMNKIISATGTSVDENKIKSLVASLKNVDIDKELESAVVMGAAAPAASAESKEEEAPKEEKKEAAAEGLSALFG